MIRCLPIIVAFGFLLSNCAARQPVIVKPAIPQTTWRYHQTGIASWYGKRNSGGRLASGERYHVSYFTAAHRSLKFGTVVRVTNLRNGRSCVVRINDRGPFIRGRVIDLAYAPAKVIGLTSCGLAKVRLEVLAK